MKYLGRQSKGIDVSRRLENVKWIFSPGNPSSWSFDLPLVLSLPKDQFRR
jgi:hypothetical protein